VRLLAQITNTMLSKLKILSAGVEMTWKVSPSMDQDHVVPVVLAYATMSTIAYALEAYLQLDKSSMSMLILLCNTLKIQKDQQKQPEDHKVHASRSSQDIREIQPVMNSLLQ